MKSTGSDQKKNREEQHQQYQTISPNSSQEGKGKNKSTKTKRIYFTVRQKEVDGVTQNTTALQVGNGESQTDKSTDLGGSPKQ